MSSKTLFGSAALLRNATEPATSDAMTVEATARAFQVVQRGAGSSAAAIEVSLDGEHFFELAQVLLDGTKTTDGFTSSAPWRYVRARVISVSDGASVDVFAGV